MRDYKELEIILGSFACDKNCPYCTAKITKWGYVEDDTHLLGLDVAEMKVLGYSFHYVTIGGNGEPTLHSYEKLKEIVEMFDGWDIPVKRVLTSGNVFRPEERNKLELFREHGWVFECTTTSFNNELDRETQDYDFNYFETGAFASSRVRLNYVLLERNKDTFIDEIKSFASKYPNIETIAIKLLNVNTLSGKVDNPLSKWIVDNAVPKAHRENIKDILDKEFGESKEVYDTFSWDMGGKEVYFSWKKMKYGFADLVWYGNRFVNYQLEDVEPELCNKVYIAQRFIKDENGSFKDDFRAKMICDEVDGKIDDDRFRNFNSDSFIRKQKDKDIPLHYIDPFWNEKASNGILTSDDCEQVVNTENRLIEMCDTFICYFDEELSPGSITELIYACMLNKKILIFYKVEDSRYKVKSSSWYPIVFAKLMADAVAIPVNSADDIIDLL